MKVVELRPAADPETVRLLREALAEAEAGRYVSMIAILEQPDGTRVTMFTHTRDLYAQLADATRLVHQIQRRMDEVTSAHGS